MLSVVWPPQEYLTEFVLTLRPTWTEYQNLVQTVRIVVWIREVPS